MIIENDLLSNENMKQNPFNQKKEEYWSSQNNVSLRQEKKPVESESSV
jgi:hypothetical protein